MAHIARMNSTPLERGGGGLDMQNQTRLDSLPLTGLQPMAEPPLPRLSMSASKVDMEGWLIAHTQNSNVQGYYRLRGLILSKHADENSAAEWRLPLFHCEVSLSAAKRRLDIKPLNLTFVADSPDYVRKWFIALRKVANRNIHDFYALGTIFGRISGGYVHSAVCRLSNREYAVMAYDLSRMKVSEQQRVEMEMMVLMTIKHEHTLRMVDLFETEATIYIILEWVPSETLEHCLLNLGRPLFESEVRDVMRGVFVAVSAWHKSTLMHRGVKLGNVLCTSLRAPFGIKLVPFTVCTRSVSGGGPVGGGGGRETPQPAASPAALPGEPSSTSHCVFRTHSQPSEKRKVADLSVMAPELLLRKPYNNAVDLWASGVLMFWLVSHRMPFVASDSAEMAQKASRVELEFGQEWSRYSRDMRAFLLRLLEPVATRRMTAEEALDHPWLRGSMSRPSSGSYASATEEMHGAEDLSFGLSAVSSATSSGGPGGAQAGIEPVGSVQALSPPPRPASTAAAQPAALSAVPPGGAQPSARGHVRPNSGMRRTFGAKYTEAGRDEPDAFSVSSSMVNGSEKFLSEPSASYDVKTSSLSVENDAQPVVSTSDPPSKDVDQRRRSGFARWTVRLFSRKGEPGLLGLQSSRRRHLLP